MTRVHVEKWCVYGHYVDGKCIRKPVAGGVFVREGDYV